MSIEANVQTAKDFFAAIGRGDRQRLLALVAEDIEWIIPGEDWPLSGTRHGHAGLENLLETASKSIETSTEPREFVAQGDRVLVVGSARGKIKTTNKTFMDDWIFAISSPTSWDPKDGSTASWRPKSPIQERSGRPHADACEGAGPRERRSRWLERNVRGALPLTSTTLSTTPK